MRVKPSGNMVPTREGENGWRGEERKNIEINSDIETLSFSKPTNKYLWQSENNHSFMGKKFNSAAITGYIHGC